MDKSAFDSVYHSAVVILSYREHSVQELQHKLLNKDFDPNVIETVLEKLIDKNYLNDHRFAEVYTEYRIAKGNGRLKIRHDLQQRGVDAVIIQTTLAVYEEQWIELAAQARQKRFNHLPKTPQQKQQQMRFLQNRGFEWSQIQACFT